MQLIDQPISIKKIEEMAKNRYGNLVKAVVDTEKEIMVMDAEMHADEEKFLLEQGSAQANLWGINLYPGKFGQDDFVEFDSMINLRPSQKNLSRDIEDPQVKEKIIKIVEKLITS